MANATGRRRYVERRVEDLVEQGGGEFGDGAGQTLAGRDEHDPDGPLVRCRVVRTFKRTAYALRVLTLRDGRGRVQTQRVTDEHPYYSLSGGWTPAMELAPGDRIRGDRDHLNRPA